MSPCVHGNAPMRANLTETAIKNAKPRPKAYKLSDEGGLYLEGSTAGGKLVLWRSYRLHFKNSNTRHNTPRGRRNHAPAFTWRWGYLTLQEANGITPQKGQTMAYQYTTWSPDLETGHAAIDNQHKQWIAAVNALFEAHKSGKGRKEVEQTMAFLVDYTIKHFSDEEKLQQRYGYPEYPAHKQTHAEFKETARGMAGTLYRDASTEEAISDVCLTMGRWVVNHIKAEDFKMTAYIRSKERNV